MNEAVVRPSRAGKIVDVPDQATFEACSNGAGVNAALFTKNLHCLFPQDSLVLRRDMRADRHRACGIL